MTLYQSLSQEIRFQAKQLEQKESEHEILLYELDISASPELSEDLPKEYTTTIKRPSFGHWNLQKNKPILIL